MYSICYNNIELNSFCNFVPRRLVVTVYRILYSGREESVQGGGREGPGPVDQVLAGHHPAGGDG